MDEFARQLELQQIGDRLASTARHHVPLATPPRPMRRRVARGLHRIARALDGEISGSA